MKKKILFTASIPTHIKAFHLPYLKWFQEQGYETHVASNNIIDLPYVDKSWKVDFTRSPFSINNLKAFKQLKTIIDSENYSLINCHTPAASVITRLAAKNARKKGTKVLYTAHGFHFYTGGPLLYWGLFYPVEIFLSKYSDAIITINQEDYNRIRTNGSNKSDYYLIPGIGVNNSRFYSITQDEKINLRKSLDFPIEKKIIIYAAEFINRKNHQFIINSVNENKEAFEDKIILLAGRGVLEESLKETVNNLKLDHIIKFIGFRRDIDKIFQLADIALSVSKQEGLPINIVEAMMTGLPIVATKVRGHVDLIDFKQSGYLFNTGDSNDFIKGLNFVLSEDRYFDISQKSLEKAKSFELSNSLNELTRIFKKYL